MRVEAAVPKLATLCLTIAFLMSGCLERTAVLSSPADWSQHYRDSTVSFVADLADREGHLSHQVIGAGIVVALSDHEAAIVTARHVFSNPQENWEPQSVRVRFAWQQGQSIDQDPGVVLNLKSATGTRLWYDSEATGDIAAIPWNALTQVPTLPKNQTLHGIGLQDFATEDDVYDGAPVFLYGFPGFVGAARSVRALTRSGVIAWTDPAGPSSSPFLIDANVFPGNSGGPVLKVPSGLSRNGTFTVGGRVAFLGIVSQTYTQALNVVQNQKGLQAITDERVAAVGLGALGVIEPASRVRSLLARLIGRAL